VRGPNNRGKAPVRHRAIGQAEQGGSVALSGDGNTAITGGPLDNKGTGAAWVFVQPAAPSLQVTPPPTFSFRGSKAAHSRRHRSNTRSVVATTLPRSRRQVGAFIAQEFGLVYESRSGLIALLHRLDLEYHKPNVIPRKLDEDKRERGIFSPYL
jgi:hypothetical protein